MAFCEAPNYSSHTSLSNSGGTGNRPTSGDDVTQLLKRWRKGSRDAESALMERVQGELRRLAAGYLRHERAGRTLQRSLSTIERSLDGLGHRVPVERRHERGRCVVRDGAMRPNV